MNSTARNLLTLSTVAGAGWWITRSVMRQQRRISFRNRVVVITGGSRGLGLVMARQLAREGARLAICARDRAALDRAEGELHRRGAAVVAVVCDVTQPDDVANFIEKVQKELGPIDVLINNAGVMQVGPVETMELADFEDSLNTHFWAPLWMIQQVAPQMKQRGFGRIVNIASIGGKIAPPHLLPYVAGKFALVGLSRGLRSELMPDGVLVTTICPGLMRTGSPRHAWFRGKHRQEHAWFSISGSLPLFSVNAERAAEEVIEACRHGQAELTISLPAKLGASVQAIAPELTACIMSTVNRLLPTAAAEASAVKEGKDSQSWISPSILTRLGDEAARRNNEIP